MAEGHEVEAKLCRRRRGSAVGLARGNKSGGEGGQEEEWKEMRSR